MSKGRSTKPGSVPRQELPNDPGHDELIIARREAAQKSAKAKGYWYIIESGDRFFVQDTCHLQGWETLHATYMGGKIV